MAASSLEIGALDQLPGGFLFDRRLQCRRDARVLRAHQRRKVPLVGGLNGRADGIGSIAWSFSVFAPSREPQFGEAQVLLDDIGCDGCKSRVRLADHFERCVRSLAIACREPGDKRERERKGRKVAQPSCWTRASTGPIPSLRNPVSVRIACRASARSFCEAAATGRSARSSRTSNRSLLARARVSLSSNAVGRTPAACRGRPLVP